MLTVTLRPHRVARTLAIVVLVMAVLSVVGQVVRYHATDEAVRELALRFKMSAELTIPAYASALLLLTAAGLLWLIARDARHSRRPFARHWMWLAGIFVYLSVDEAAALHELATVPMQRVLGGYAIGVFHYAWAVPAGATVLVLGLVYLRFVLHLSPPVRDRVIVAGSLYVGGALGMEMVGAYYASTISTETIRYALSALIEETMEMLGIVLFIHGLLIQLSGQAGTVQVALAPASLATTASSGAPLRSSAASSAVNVQPSERTLKPARSLQHV